MGSPEDEPGRFNKEFLERFDFKSEGSHYSVERTRGYWLFDTPVTQAFYEAVTGENPSEFKSAQQPVEHVSWNDAQRFIL
jgi:formylglycine-generating enzyme required for sulfatase activity